VEVAAIRVQLLGERAQVVVEVVDRPQADLVCTLA